MQKQSLPKQNGSPMMREEKGDQNGNERSGYEGVGRFYDLFADNSDIPFFLKYAKKIGSSILDLAAGTGRITFALAKDGHEVVALENSQSMLEVAKQKLKDASSDIANKVILVEGDMTNFNLARKFELVIIPNSIGHAMTDKEQLSTLQCIHNHLTDNGVFILDTYPGEMQYEHAEFKENPVPLPDGTTVERHGEIRSNMLNKIMIVNLQYIVRDSEQNIVKKMEVVSSAALLYNEDIDLLISRSGFVVVEELGGFDEQSYSSDSGRRILILKKSKEKW
jgi:SAM-dependent methyltransferase